MNNDLDAAHYDALESRDAAAREAALSSQLPAALAHACAASRAMAQQLAGIDPQAVRSRTALSQLPVTRKHELLERQQAERASDPFGGFSAIGWRGLARASGARRVFQSPGPIYEPEGHAADYWRVARAIHAAGFRAGDLVHCSFSYHLTPAGSMMDTGAQALGCTVFAGGVGHTDLQLQAIAELRPHGYIGTPSFLKILVDKAEQTGASITSMRKAMVSGEAFPAGLRSWLAERGIDGYQCYASADLGLIAYETSAREGLVVDEGVIVEIVRPGTGDPVPDGEVGEVVVTTLNPDYPLIRFGTGDLSAILPGTCPTGRTNARIKGWMGRADQTAKVRGMFVHPGQVAQIVGRHAQVVRARLVISGDLGNDRMLLRVEVAGAPGALAEQLAGSARDITKLRAEIELVAPGSLPNDGKVIDDTRAIG